MDTIATDTMTTSAVGRLAVRLENDIRRRGLLSGDRYLTAVEAGHKFGVSPMTANRAMNILAKREMLVRHRSRGSFVGPALEAETKLAASCVHYLSSEDSTPTLQLPVGNMVAGLRSELTDVTFQSHFVPLRDALRHVQREAARQAADPAFAGFVLALSSREVQEYLAASDLPVVVYGSVYPGIDLPFVEIDQKQVGRLMAQQAIDAGHRRLIVLNRETWRQGDTLMLDGIAEVVHTAGLGASAVTIRNISLGLDAAATEIGHLLDELHEPTALLCRLPHIANGVIAWAAKRGLAMPEDVAVIYDDVREDRLPLPCPCVCCQIDVKKQFALIGRMLARMREGRRSDPHRVILPVELIQPLTLNSRKKETPM